MKNNTIDYYNRNAYEYFDLTIHSDVKDNQNKFIKYLNNKAKILDFGCGSGRDVKFFQDLGFTVYGIDGSNQMCNLARKYTGNTNIVCMNFLEFNEDDIYDGIWACATLLHLNKKELDFVFNNMINATKNNGIIYMSFKYGKFIGLRDDRFYLDMNEENLNCFIRKFKEVKVEELWVSKDVLPGRGDQKWMNVILRVTKQ